MTAAQYREAMGLDPVVPETTKTRVTVKHENEKPLGEGLFMSINRLMLRLLWVAGWAWLIFTFGWVGHVIVRLTGRWLER